jgi:hypothetical protein
MNTEVKSTLPVQVARALSALERTIPNPDAKHNRGVLLGKAALWDEALDYCKRQSEGAWKALEASGIIEHDETLAKGDYELCNSPHFACTLKISAPVKRFDSDALVQAMVKRFKCTAADALAMIEAAKVPGNPRKSFAIVER